MDADTQERRCIVCASDLSLRLQNGYTDPDLCPTCRQSIIATFKRVYTSLSGPGQRQFASYFNLQKT